MKGRLYDLLNNVHCKAECCSALDGGRCGDLDKLDRCQLEAIADHLIANGVIVPPCKVGDTVYIIDEGDGECTEDFVLDVKVQELIITDKGLACILKLPLGMRCSVYTKIGVNVFLTKEEAKKALQEKENERTID